jgi:hypothetical protein
MLDVTVCYKINPLDFLYNLNGKKTDYEGSSFPMFLFSSGKSPLSRLGKALRRVTQNLSTEKS